MESNSEPGRIQCSRKSYELLQTQLPDLKLLCRGAIHIKGKGRMITYWVNEERSPEMAETKTIEKKGYRVVQIKDEKAAPTSHGNEFRQFLRQGLDPSSSRHSDSSFSRDLEV